MADIKYISKITLPVQESFVTYQIKDAVAREALSKINSFSYVICDSASNTPEGVTNGEVTGTLAASDSTLAKIYLVPSENGAKDIYDEYITVKKSSTEYVWEMFGNTDVHMSDLGALAKKDNASTSYKPSGTVSVPGFTGTEGDLSVKGTAAGSISTGTGTSNYTPSGSLEGGQISVSLTTEDKYVASSATSGGSVTAGSAAKCTLPTMNMSVADETETLTLDWTAGSFTANVPTAVTMPTFDSATVASAVSEAKISTLPTFKGNGVELKFTGTQTTATGKFTPEGTVDQPTFTGTIATITVS